MSTLIERLSQVRSEKRITLSAIAKASGNSEQTIISQMYGRRQVSLSTIDAILRLCPTIDARWLITGEESKSRLEIRIDAIENEIEAIKTEVFRNK